MQRKLASIQKILDIQPIERADAIEVASILGWKVVVKKGEFKVGDLVVYAEIDAVFPPKEEFEFLRNKKYRIRTIRLRSQLSQGICFSLSILPDQNVNEGDDVTEVLGIVKWEPAEPIILSGDNKGRFPSVPKTDEIRLQSFPKLIEEFQGLECYSSVKIDGTSSTFANMNGEIDVCSRKMSKKEGDTVYWKMAEKYNILDILKEVGNFAIQGEIAGPGIQKNRLGLQKVDLFVFNVYNISETKYLDFTEFIRFCQRFNLTTVPIENDGFVFNHNLDQLLDMAKGKYDGTNNNREGLVIRPLIERYSEVLNGRLSMKIINNDFLLKNGE